MRSIVSVAIAAAGLVLASAEPTLPAPVNASAICKAAAKMNPVTQARCWCSYRAFSGRCQRWRCR